MLLLHFTTARLSVGAYRADASYFPDKSAFLDVECATLGSALLSRKPYQPLYLNRNLDASALWGLKLYGGTRAHQKWLYQYAPQ